MVRAGGIRAGPGDGGRGAAARTELDPVVAIAVTRNGQFWNVIDRRVRRPDGSVVEVDRQTCWDRDARRRRPISSRNRSTTRSRMSSHRGDRTMGA